MFASCQEFLVEYTRNRNEILESDVQSLRRDVNLLVKRTRNSTLPELQEAANFRRKSITREWSSGHRGSVAEEKASESTSADRACACSSCRTLFARLTRTSDEVNDEMLAKRLILEPLFPCLVLSLSDLRDFDVMPTYNQVHTLGILKVLTAATTHPSASHTIFISHVSRQSTLSSRHILIPRTAMGDGGEGWLKVSRQRARH